MNTSTINVGDLCPLNVSRTRRKEHDSFIPFSLGHEQLFRGHFAIECVIHCNKISGYDRLHVQRSLTLQHLYFQLRQPTSAMSNTTFIGLLSRLVASGEFKTLHEQLKTFFDSSYRKSCEENTAFCCELIELHANLQGQLFHLLELCCSEGGIYGGCEALKKRLLPWLRGGFLTSRINTEDIEIVTGKYELILKKMDDDLSAAKEEAAELRIK